MSFYILADISSVSEGDINALREYTAPYFSKSVNLKRKESVCAKAVLCDTLKNHFGLKSFFVDCHSNGKPFITNGELCFNISHSGSYVLLAFSENPIGCDIESVKPYTAKIAERFFCPGENDALSVSNHRDMDFIKLWTLKESILKFSAEGMSGGLSSYDFSKHLVDESFEEYGCFFHSFYFENYYVSICSKEKGILQLNADIGQILKELKN